MKWNDVQPTLAATYRLLETVDQVDGSDVAQELSLANDDAGTARALRYLREADYIDAYLGGGMDPMPHLIRATEKGLQAASGWPSIGSSLDQADVFLRALEETAQREDVSEADHGRLQQLRQAAFGVGRDLLAEVIAKMAEHQTGL